MNTSAIVPVKSLPAAKGRLAGVLDAHQRRALVVWMAQRVLRACSACPLITDILVVAGDADSAAVAAEEGARAIVVDEPGLAAALRAGDLAVAGAMSSIVVAADLPALTSDDLTAVVTAAGREPRAVVIAPTDDGGTGALLRRPAGLFPTAYGPGSAARHAALAADAGLRAVLVHRRGLALDVDTPEQLPAALALFEQHDVGCAPR